LCSRVAGRASRAVLGASAAPHVCVSCVSCVSCMSCVLRVACPSHPGRGCVAGKRGGSSLDPGARTVGVGLCVGQAWPRVPRPDGGTASLSPARRQVRAPSPARCPVVPALPRALSRPQPVYKADLLPCSPAGPEDGEQALPKTRLYSEMVTKSYIRFRDTDLVGGWAASPGGPDPGWDPWERGRGPRCCGSRRSRIRHSDIAAAPHLSGSRAGPHAAGQGWGPQGGEPPMLGCRAVGPWLWVLAPGSAVRSVSGLWQQSGVPSPGREPGGHLRPAPCCAWPCSEGLAWGTGPRLCPQRGESVGLGAAGVAWDGGVRSARAALRRHCLVGDPEGSPRPPAPQRPPCCAARAARTAVRAALLPRARGSRRCRRFAAQLQELPQPGADAQDARAGGEGRAEPGPPAAGVPAQGEDPRSPPAARRAPAAPAPSLLTPFSPRRCASAPTWTRRAGWCRAGRRASCGRTAWRGWPPARAAGCCRSAAPASARCTGTRRAAPARSPHCRQSSTVASSCCHHMCLGRGLGGPCAPPQCFSPSGPPPRGRDGCSQPSPEPSGHLSSRPGPRRILLRCLV